MSRGGTAFISVRRRAFWRGATAILRRTSLGRQTIKLRGQMRRCSRTSLGRHGRRSSRQRTMRYLRTRPDWRTMSIKHRQRLPSMWLALDWRVMSIWRLATRRSTPTSLGQHSGQRSMRTRTSRCSRTLLGSPFAELRRSDMHRFRPKLMGICFGCSVLRRTLRSKSMLNALLLFHQQRQPAEPARSLLFLL